MQMFLGMNYRGYDMDPTIINLLIQRLDKMETKIDMLLASHNKRIGISIAASFFFSTIIGIVIAFIERH